RPERGELVLERGELELEGRGDLVGRGPGPRVVPGDEGVGDGVGPRDRGVPAGAAGADDDRVRAPALVPPQGQAARQVVEGAGGGGLGWLTDEPRPRVRQQLAALQRGAVGAGGERRRDGRRVAGLELDRAQRREERGLREVDGGVALAER